MALKSCVEALSWVIEVWKKDHLLSDGNLQRNTSLIPKNVYRGMTNIVGLTFSASDTKHPI